MLKRLKIRTKILFILAITLLTISTLLATNRLVLDEIILFSEMNDFINRPLRTYSSGMVARLGFSVIAYLEPSILLIDEILAVGDDNFQKKCKIKLENFRSKGTTIIFVSHDLDDINELCDRVFLLNDGTLIDQGPQ